MPVKKTSPSKTARPQRRRTTTGKLTLPQNIRIGQTRTLKEDLAKLLAGRKKIELDASKVEKADTSALQLLAAFFIKAADQSVEIRWRSPSEALIVSAHLLGLGEQLKLHEYNEYLNP